MSISFDLFQAQSNCYYANYVKNPTQSKSYGAILHKLNTPSLLKIRQGKSDQEIAVIVQKFIANPSEPLTSECRVLEKKSRGLLLHIMKRWATNS